MIPAAIWMACTGPSTPPPPPDDRAETTTAETGSTPSTPPVDDLPVGIDPLDDLSGLAGLACASGMSCAPEEAGWLGDTCCAFGDAMEDRYHDPTFPEGVDIEASGRVVVGCSGFGAFVGDALPDGTIVSEKADMKRCQRAAIGRRAADGSRLVVLANHGDTFSNPELVVVRRSRTNTLENVERLAEKGVLYEGLALFDGTLWVAAHAGGVRVYAMAEDGTLTWLRTLGGFDNAAKLAVEGTLAYVSDNQTVRILDASDPAKPSIVGSVAVGGLVRDVVADATHVFVALGVGGVEVLRREGAGLVPQTHLDGDGSVQAVDLTSEHVALASWDHLALLERDGLERIGGIKLKAQFEETYAVAFGDDFLFALEWYGAHTVQINQGFVAPELAADAELVAFDGRYEGSTTLGLHNRGPLNALVGSVVASQPHFGGAAKVQRLLPGERGLVRVTYAGPPVPKDPLDTHLSVFSNDPSPTESPLDVVLVANHNKLLLDVGDTLTEDFAFLDPTGAGDLDNLRGQVTVLAYFALF